MNVRHFFAPMLVICLALLACSSGQADAVDTAKAGNSMNASTSNETPAPPPPMRGKRAGPVDVAPVRIGKISYEVLHWGRLRDLPQNGGYLIAKDAKGKELWLAQIYKTSIDPKMEGDVQDVFITSLRLAADGKTLEMSDEKGRHWRFDPQARKVLP